MWLERAERIRTQQRHDKNKLSALHAPEVECIGKGKARKPYEFGVKVSLAVTHKQGLMVGARSFRGNPYDGHILAAQLEQITNLMQDLGRSPTQAIEPMIGHTKSDNRMDRCWLQGALGDALHALSCAAGYNIRWLVRAIARLGLELVYLRLSLAAVTATSSVKSSYASRLTARARSVADRQAWSTPASSFASA